MADLHPETEEQLCDALWNLTREIVTRHPELHVVGILGGEFGYGARWENDTFLMHPFCWCEEPDCPWCAAGLHGWADKGALGAPNLWHKPSGFRVWWYNYIGRGMEVVNLPADLAAVFAECVASLGDRENG